MKLHYERTFRIAQYESERIGFEYDTANDTITSMQDAPGIQEKLRELAELVFTDRYPGLANTIPQKPVKVEMPMEEVFSVRKKFPIEETIQSIGKPVDKKNYKKYYRDEIERCTTMEELQSWISISQSYGLTQEWSNKQVELEGAQLKQPV